MYMRLLLIFLVSGLLLGCSSKFKSDSSIAPTASLNSSNSIYIMLASDGRYGSRTYSGSGRTVSEHVYTAVVRRLVKAELATQPHQQERALAIAREKGFSHVFEPRIIHWEDRATEWSGKPDRISIYFAVWEVASGRVVASSTERASSKWMTFGGDHPQDLVPRMVDNFTNKLFR